MSLLIQCCFFVIVCGHALALSEWKLFLHQIIFSVEITFFFWINETFLFLRTWPAVCSLLIHCHIDCFTEDSTEEHEDPELGKAVRKMKRLDRILALKALAEREVKQKGREQHQRLWQELQVRLYIQTHQNFVRMPLFFGDFDPLQAVSLRMSSNETENTRRFLALTPDTCEWRI